MNMTNLECFSTEEFETGFLLRDPERNVGNGVGDEKAHRQQHVLHTRQQCKAAYYVSI